MCQVRSICNTVPKATEDTITFCTIMQLKNTLAKNAGKCQGIYSIPKTLL